MKNSLIAVTISAALASGVSFADAKAITGVTMGLEAGVAAFQGTPDLSNISSDSSETNGGFLLRGMLGYDFALSSQFAIGLETGISNGFNLYSESTTAGPDNASSKTSDFSAPILLKAIYVMPFGLNFFIKGGMAYHKYTTKVNVSISGGPDFSGSNSYSKWTPEAAVGVGYLIGNLNIFAQYSHTFGKSLDTIMNQPAISANVLTAGLSYTIPI